jgi:hypothetical protein
MKGERTDEWCRPALREVRQEVPERATVDPWSAQSQHRTAARCAIAHSVIPSVNPHNLSCLFPSESIVPAPQPVDSCSSWNSGTKPAATQSGSSGRSRAPNLVFLALG